jgi:hypothetical protein
MGDSKRRKQIDPNYGKTAPLKPQLINSCNSVLALETAFVVLDFWEDAGGVAIAAGDISNLADNQLAAYNIASQPSFMNLGIRRQQEQALGAMSLMERTFRRRVLPSDSGDHGHLVFNWLSDREIERAVREANNAKKGRAVVFQIMDFLIHNCDREYQFPCWFSGIPFISTPSLFLDLIFICDKRRPSSKEIKTINYETFS